MKSGDWQLETAATELGAPAWRARPPAGMRVELAGTNDESRAGFEEFIAARFSRAFGARVKHFLPSLLGVRDRQSRLQAACGYGEAIAGDLFLEQYLDQPVEVALTAALGRPVPRSRIIEVGNLAAVSAGLARELIPLLARHLHRRGYQWVTFTATRELRNSFRRLGLEPLALGPADPAHLPDRGANWGSYYRHDPQVMAGRIALGLRARSDP